jgi:outer membrane biosynthesis protein TonB
MASLPLVQIGDDIQGNPSPSVVLVLVSEEGKVIKVSGKQVSNDPMFHVKAMTFARTLEFKPAQKNGTPVRAWHEVMLRPTRNK